MALETATNSFTEGIENDTSPLLAKNSTLYSALNALIVTGYGNEMILLTALGNLKIVTSIDDVLTAVKLKNGYIPIGIKQYAGILYIVSCCPYNHTDDGISYKCEIGTYPSPDYDQMDSLQGASAVGVYGELNIPLLYRYLPLRNLININLYDLALLLDAVLMTHVYVYNNTYYTNSDRSIALTKQSTYVYTDSDGVYYYLLQDFNTSYLNFDLLHPVSIEIQTSYDSSVNLILNDGKNIPRLINSRFALSDNGKAKIPKRRKSDDTIYSKYNSTSFDISTSLTKVVSLLPIVDFLGLLDDGKLGVGNYVVYLKFCDNDGNETQWVAESGIISVFKGTDGDPFSIDGGISSMNSYKGIRLSLSNVDKNYHYIKIYYSRSYADKDLAAVVSVYEIVEPQELIIVDDIAYFTITGNETVTLISLSELNIASLLFISAKSQAQCQNMLIFANIKEQNFSLLDLMDLSLRFNPYIFRLVSKHIIGLISMSDYSDAWDVTLGVSVDTSEFNSLFENSNHKFNSEYYNSSNIYYNVGYSPGEYYRLGVVYIYKNNDVSNVFNILGGVMTLDTITPITTAAELDTYENRYVDSIAAINYSPNIYSSSCYRKFISYDNDGYITDSSVDSSKYVNVKGIIKINDPLISDGYTPTSFLYVLGIFIPADVLTYLTSLGIMGFFFVRQKRIPIVACQGFTLPWDKEAKIPIIEYWGWHIPYQIPKTKAAGGHYCPTIRNYSWKDSYSKNYINYIGGKTTYLRTALMTLSGYNSKNINAGMWGKLYFTEIFVCNGYNELSITEHTDPLEPADASVALLSNNFETHRFPILSNCIDEKVFSYSIENADFNTDNVLLCYMVRLTVEGESSDSEDDESETSDIITIVEDNSSSFISGGWFIRKGLTFYFDKVTNAEKLLNRLVINKALYSDTKNIEYSTISVYLAALYFSGDVPSSGNYYTELSCTLLGKIEIFSGTEEELDDSSFSFFSVINNPAIVISDDGSVTISYTDTSTNEEIGEIIYELDLSDLDIEDYTTPTSGYKVDCSYLTAALLVNVDTGCLIKSYTELSSTQTITVSLYYNNMQFGPRNRGEFRSGENSWKYSGEHPGFVADDYIGDDFNAYRYWYDRYKHCDCNLLTAICPEFEVNQAYWNLFFTGASYYIRYTNTLLGILCLQPNNPRLFVPEYFPTCGSLSYAELLALNKSLNWGPPTSTPDETLYTFFLALPTYKICAVTDGLPSVAIDNTVFKSVIGSASDASRFSYVNEIYGPWRYACAPHDHHDMLVGGSSEYYAHFNAYPQASCNLVRGIYSPYLGIVASSTYENGVLYREKDRGYCRRFNIYYHDPDTSVSNEMKIRMQDNSPYYSISQRILISLAPSSGSYKYIPEFIKYAGGYLYFLYRGDSFLCTFTHRVNRNFNDPSVPTNSHIVDYTTWRDNYAHGLGDDLNAKLDKINRGDINAVELGIWITIKIRASMNLSIRSLDESYVNEEAEFGHARGFYPLQQASADGNFKLTDSYVFNSGFKSTLGPKEYYGILSSLNYDKSEFNTRICYSLVAATDAIKNNYRTFSGVSYLDYTKEYGEITKIIELDGNILCVFEHGVGRIDINREGVLLDTSTTSLFLGNSSVLPSKLTVVLSSTFGSKYPDSVIKTPYRVYGVDTEEKKIWSTSGNDFSVISDFKIERFLLENLNLNLNDNNVFLGIKNVSTHWNATNNQVIFTFYNKSYSTSIITDDCTSDITSIYSDFNDDETAFSIAYCPTISELGAFITFYSWIPLISENIGDVFYTFDRECSRDLILSAWGDSTVKLLDNQEFPFLDIETDEDIPWSEYYVTEGTTTETTTKDKMVPYLWKHGPLNELFPFSCFWYNQQHPFEICFTVNDQALMSKTFNSISIIGNNVAPESIHITIPGRDYSFRDDFVNIYVRQEATKALWHNLGSTLTYNDNYIKLINKLMPLKKSTIFPLYYEHINLSNTIYDTYVSMLDTNRDYSALSGTEVNWDEKLKTFSLTIHKKCLLLTGDWILVDKSTYSDYDIYNRKSEIRGTTTLYLIFKAGSRLRANMHYDLGHWLILLPTISLSLKNEQYYSSMPPLVINNYSMRASDLTDLTITDDVMPVGYSSTTLTTVIPSVLNVALSLSGLIDLNGWTYRKEAKIRDKYMRVLIRYSGLFPVSILAVLTSYSINY